MSTQESSEERFAARFAVSITARLRDRGTPFEIKIVDMSTSGFRAETVHNVPIGLRVFIRLPGLSGIEAEAVWRSAEHIGFTFRTPLHPAVLENVVAASRR